MIQHQKSLLKHAPHLGFEYGSFSVAKNYAESRCSHIWIWPNKIVQEGGQLHSRNPARSRVFYGSYLFRPKCVIFFQFKKKHMVMNIFELHVCLVARTSQSWSQRRNSNLSPKATTAAEDNNEKRSVRNSGQSGWEPVDESTRPGDLCESPCGWALSEGRGAAF